MKIPAYHGPEYTNRKADNFIGHEARNKSASDSANDTNRPGAGTDSVTITGNRKVSERAVYSMSDLKGKADRALSAQNALKEQRVDRPEPLVDIRISATRRELMELARLRISAGFYNRPDVIDAMAKRIIDNG
ncbi:MAG: hypothetical protein IH914_07160 [candidate division Zixibacteria bacterium]|nr:hypothetical protein [candidate division Zixibacteria bacterium]